MHRVLFSIPNLMLWRVAARPAVLVLVLLGVAAVAGAVAWFFRGVSRRKKEDPEFEALEYLGPLLGGLAFLIVAVVLLNQYLVGIQVQAGYLTVALKQFEIYTYGPVMALAFLCAFFLVFRLAQRRGEDVEFYMDLYILLIIFGLLGSKALYSLIELREWWPDFREHPGKTLAYIMNCRNGGLVWYGGVILCIGVVYWYSRRRGLPMFQVTDTLVAPLALGLAIGRIGCLMGGCCYGQICDLPWAIQYPQSCIVDSREVTIMPWDPRFHDPAFFSQHSCQYVLPLQDMAAELGIKAPLDVLHVHPSPLYETIASLAICAIIYLTLRRQARTGVATAIWFTLYPIARFLLEFLRGDVARKFVYQGPSFHLSTSQFIGIFVLIPAAGLWYYLFSRPPQPIVTAPVRPDEPARPAKKKEVKDKADQPAVKKGRK